jgi:hypothetical protein
MYLKSIGYTDTVLFPSIGKAGDVVLPYFLYLLVTHIKICCRLTKTFMVIDIRLTKWLETVHYPYIL